MVQSCSAYNCTQRQKRETDISFHRFPKGEDLRRKWIVAMGRSELKVSKYSALCSKHFPPECYISNGWSSRKALDKDAVPTLFDFPQHSIKVEKHLEESPSNCLQNQQHIARQSKVR